MATVNWITTNPSDASAVGLGANDIRVVKQAINTGLGESLNFFNTADPVKQGAMRPFVGTSSADSYLSRINQAGRSYFQSDTSRWVSYASEIGLGGGVGTTQRRQLIGSPRYIEHATAANGAVRMTVSTRTQLTAPNTAGQNIAFLNSTLFAEAPFVVAMSSSTAYAPDISGISEGGFTVRLRPVGSFAASNITIFWFASGISRGPV